MTAAFCRLPPPLRSSSFRREQVQSSICSRHACVPSAVWKRAKRSANEKPARPRHVPKKRRADIARTPSRPSLSLGDAERLHKVLSRLGVASRRGAEALIGQSRVRVNGRVIQEQGMLVNARKDRIEVDGGVVTIADSAVWMVVHKMRGSVCVPRGGGGRWVGSFLCDGSLVCVDGIEGRATGVVVLTNERGVVGDFASRGGELVREWIVDCGGVLDQGVLKRVVDGVKLEGEAELGKFSVRV